MSAVLATAASFPDPPSWVQTVIDETKTERCVTWQHAVRTSACKVTVDQLVTRDSEGCGYVISPAVAWFDVEELTSSQCIELAEALARAAEVVGAANTWVGDDQPGASGHLTAGEAGPR